ncbi:MAG: EAL domain-containing protein [Treponema sp.]|nr:EAL domain-containing protein [Treponema sp.]
MLFGMEYSLCGFVCLCVIFILNCITNNFPTRTNIIYRFFMISVLLGTFFQGVSVVFVKILPVDYNWIKYIAWFCFIGVSNLEAILYYMFIVSISHEQLRFRKIHLFLVVLPFIYESITLISNYFTHFVFYIDADGNYVRQLGLYIFYAIDLYYLLICLFELIKNRASLKTIIYVAVFSVFVLIGMGVQLLKPDTNILSFCISMSFIIINYILRNPRELHDANNGAYNRIAFREFYFCNKKKLIDNKVLALVQLSNFDVILSNYGSSKCYSILRQIIPVIMKKVGIKYCFYLFHNSFLFTCKDKESALEILEYIKWYMPSPKDLSDGIRKNPLHHVQVDRDLFILENTNFIDLVDEDTSEYHRIDALTELLQYAVVINSNHNSINIIDDKVIDEFIAAKKRQKAIHEAIQDQSFEVYMQPIYDLKSKTFTGAESLLRLKDENGNFIPPSLFIPDAEKDGSIIKLGEISLRKTCEYIKHGNLVSKGIKKVNINLSIIQCMQDNIVEQIINILDEYQIPPDLIRFEITETIMATNPEQLEAVMRGLGEFGIEFALDDYGTGYSNTSRLLNFPFSEIKFDKSFVNSMVVDDKNSIPLKYLMNMVKSSGMITLVEGVEEKETSDLIEEFGGDLIQGFYYAKPMPLEEFKKKISN